MANVRNNRTAVLTIIGTAVLAGILLGTAFWMGRSARRDTESVVRSVSNLYLDELAGRRKQVVEHNLAEKAQIFETAIAVMTEEDRSDREHMMAYQSRIMRLLSLDLFSFVDEDGLICSAAGYETNIADYEIDWHSLQEPHVSVYHPGEANPTVLIAVPVHIMFQDKTLVAGIIGLDMETMLEGTSMTTNTDDTTFCNLYTRSGTALTNAVLGGLAQEDNLLDAMKNASFESPYTYALFAEEFENGTRGSVSFTYNGIRETLAYIPITGTDWQLTYLIRESVISERISHISEAAVTRSIVQLILTVAAMLGMFAFILDQIRQSAKLQAEKEKADAENRIKQEELTRRLELNEKLLEEERARKQQENLIAALSSDYWSVYYLNLDTDMGICYQPHGDLDGTGLKAGEHFHYRNTVTDYANSYVTESFRDAFLQFVQPENVKKQLESSRVTAFTYLVNRHGRERYETVRFADPRQPEKRDGTPVSDVSACFADTDAETRKNAAQNQALSDALNAAKEASSAKTAFLSNMSHEIRTPMNAIIGLDTIALNDPETPEKTREYLTRIRGSAEHLLSLINDILDMSRIESGRMVLRREPFSLPELLETISAMFSAQCHDRGIDYQCRIIGDMDESYVGDSVKLRQVLINILGNAVKFTSEGSVTLEVKRVAQFDGKSTIQFTVTDTGIGMSEEFLPGIFEAFHQEDNAVSGPYGSSGLGLAITKRIVEMMNGHIEVSSAKGAGSVFTVTVTLDDGKTETAEETRNTESNDRPAQAGLETAAHLAGRRVLLAEDVAVNAEIMETILQMRDVRTEIAGNGRLAAEKFAASEPGYYDAVLMDVRMPEMDGLTAARAIRAMEREDAARVPIIALTANAFDEDVQRSLQAGMNAHLSKPVQPDVLFETLERLIAESVQIPHNTI